MRPADGRHAASLLTLLGLALGSYLLSLRFYRSASFERPVLFTIGTLLVSSFALRRRRRWDQSDGQSPAVETLREATNKAYGRDLQGLIFQVFDTLRRIDPVFRTLLFAIVIRTILLWYTLRSAQCSVRGVESLLPFLTSIVDGLLGYRPGRLPNTKADTTSQTTSTKRTSIWRGALLLISLAQAVFFMWVLDDSIISTGAVCPVGRGIWAFTPYLQLVMCGLDALILVQLSRLRLGEIAHGCDASGFLGTLCWSAAACIATVAFLPILIEISTIHILRVHWIDIRDILLDSCIATCVILSLFTLLADVRPTTLALVLVGLGLFGFRSPDLATNPLLPHSSLYNSSILTLALSILTGILLFTANPPHGTSRPAVASLIHRWIKLGYLILLGICITCSVIYAPIPANIPLAETVNQLFQDAELSANQWTAQASTSDSLGAAVAEYEKRYGIPPPPNFDKWYEFAKTSRSPIIDSFDQIHSDLLPFWGVDPAQIRSQTGHLLEHASLGFGGLRIRNGLVEQSPNIPGTHRWMADSIARMIQPFAQWLPDMDIAINLGDESRVTVPYDEKQLLTERALETRARMQTSFSSGSKSSTTGWAPKSNWPVEWLPIRGDFYNTKIFSPYFSDNLRKQIYYEWVAPTCSPRSPARNTRWWDKSTLCTACLEPHSILTDGGAILANMTMAGDICHQPDLAYLNGFMLSPTVISTKELFPIFSQSRTGGFSDILFPSPWNFASKSEYEENKDMNWADKVNALFWRGSSSDGFAWDGTWTGFLRARFVNEGYKQAIIRHDDTVVGVNITFAGDISKAHTTDSLDELSTFAHWGKATLPQNYIPSPEDGPLPRPTTFDEHWHYKHLMDMDGAGFSGRFIPFLQSRSLVYRAAIFKTWFDERLQAWHHYVPVDVRLGRGFWSLLSYLSSTEERGEPVHTGDDIAQRIAQRGRDWAAKALRAEDMQVYMFRLLLEWGRIVDDERENLGLRMGEPS